MSNASSGRLKKILWFLKRPALYAQLFRKVFNGRSALTQTRAQAEAWCAEQAISSAEALARITGSAPPVSFEEKFRDALAQAEETARNCPVKMGGPGELNLLYGIAEHLQAKKVMETGVAYGWSSLAILLSLAQRDGSLLISSDMPYPGLDNEPHVGCVVPLELRSHWRLVRRDDRSALPQALQELGAIDMCHYDSDKTHEGRTWAYGLLWGALRAGGCFLSDDIGDNVAFRDFCRAIKANPIIVRAPSSSGTKYVGVLMK